MQRAVLALLLFTASCTSSTAATSTTETIPPITTTSITMPTGPGSCGTPLLTDERVPSVELADELIARFIADRSAGIGAEGCLTETAAQGFVASTFPLCLYTCSDIAQIQLPDTPKIQSEGEATLGPVRSLIVEYQIEDRIHRKMREVYKVQTVRGPGDTRQVLIDSVFAEPETMVPDVAGRQAIEDLLAALADGAWDVVGSLLVNQGTTAAIEARFPDHGTTPWDQLLEPFCATALCDAPYEILGGAAGEAQRRTFEVRFTSTEGPVEVEIPVVAFEGQLTAGDLPPEGSSDEHAVSAEGHLFPDGAPDRLMLIRYNALQVAGPDGFAWYAWPSARNAPDAQAVAGRVLFTGFGGVRLASYALGTVEVQKVIAADPWRLAGVAMVEEIPIALLTDGRRVIAYNLDANTLETLVSLEGDGSSIGCATIGGGQILVTSTSDNTTTYDLYGLADLNLLGHLEPEKASGCGILSPDGLTFVYTADVSLGNPQTIVLASAIDGTEIDRWSVLADAVITSSAFTTSLAFDGRYAVADLAVPPLYAPYAESEDLGRRFVIDTKSGDQWTADTAVHVLFPPG